MKRWWLGAGRTLAAALCFADVLAAAQSPDPVAEITSRLRAKDPAAALSLSNRALVQHSHDCRVFALRAVAYTQLAQLDNAFTSFQQSLTFCPTYLPALEGASQIAFQQNSAETEPLLKRVLALQPANPIAQGTLATVLYRRADCKSALPHLRRLQH